MDKGFLKTILRSNQSVFTFKDLLLLWGGVDPVTARQRVSYYVQQGDLYSIRRGIYAKDKRYDRLELATRIYTPAYISFETVLGRSGITFQYYSQIFIASYQSKELIVEGQKIVFKKINYAILTNPAGIEQKANYAIASPERAFLDVVYLHKEYHFDQLSLIDWDKVAELLPIYGNNKAMMYRITMYREALKE